MNGESFLSSRNPQFSAEEAKSRELDRRQEWRSRYLVPVYFMHTNNVPQVEARAAFQGVIDAVKASGQDREVVNFGYQAYGTGNYSSPDWYVAEAYKKQVLRRDAGLGHQIDAKEISNLSYQEPWQQHPHWEVFVVNHDLNGGSEKGYYNFVFGYTNMLFPASVQSITRLTAEVPVGELRLAMIRRLLRHEVGHMFGLPGRNRGNIEQKLGTHCTNVCTMKQGMSIKEWADSTREETSRRIHFCQDCMEDLAQARNRYKPIPRQN